MISDIIKFNPDLGKKLNHIKSEIFVKQLVVLFVLNFLHVFCKEFLYLISINLCAVILLVKLNEFANSKKYNREIPSLKIVIVHEENDRKSNTSPYVIIKPSGDSSKFDVDIEEKFGNTWQSCSQTNLHAPKIESDDFPNGKKVTDKNQEVDCKSFLQKDNTSFDEEPIIEDKNLFHNVHNHSSQPQSKTEFSQSIDSHNKNQSCDPPNAQCDPKFDPKISDTLKIKPISDSAVHKTVSSKRIVQNSKVAGCKNKTICSYDFQMNEILSILPKFNGESKTFLRFKHRFQTIINQLDLNYAQKGLFLYLSLDVKVSETVKIISNENIDYNDLWDKLDCEYCGPQHGPLYNGAVLNTLNTWSICDTFEKLKHLYEFILSNYRSLEIQGPVEHDLVTAIAILSKVEGDLASNISRLISESPGKPVVFEILKFIKAELNMLELNKLVCGTHEDLKNTESKTITKNFKMDSLNECNGFKNSSTTKKCTFCSYTHDSNNCSWFQSPYEFYYCLKRKNACFNCTEVGHRAFACPKPKICNLCSDPRKHLQVLCYNNY